MEPLSDEQVTIILDRIITDGVTNRDMQNGLLDHYCCFIEEKLSSGVDFESAYTIAFTAITPNGMHEIQEELYFILTFNQQTIMKRIIYGFSFLAAFFISTGTMFRTMHWDGTPILMFTGFLFLMIIAVLLLSKSIKNVKSHSPSYNARAIAGLISALLISTGSIFKTFSYPTANMQILAGMVLFSFVFLPMFFYQLYQDATHVDLKAN